MEQLLTQTSSSVSLPCSPRDWITTAARIEDHVSLPTRRKKKRRTMEKKGNRVGKRMKKEDVGDH